MIRGARGDGRARILLVLFVLLALLVVGRAGALSAQATEPPPREAIEQALHGLGHAPDDPFDGLRRAYHLSVHDRDHLVAAQQELDGLGADAVGSGDRDVAAGSAALGHSEMLVLAYLGALKVLRARHARWPIARLSHLRAGMADLDRAVAEAPSHLEVRYLRLVSEAHLPWPFRRDAVVTEDREVLRSALGGGTHGLSVEMVSFMAGVLDTVSRP